jgi:DNA-binding transcriptional ArsR family regulator
MLVDPTRIRILGRLLAGPLDRASLAGELRIAPTALNRHLDALVVAGLVEVRGDAPGVIAARPDRLGALARALAELDREAHGSIPGEAEAAEAGLSGAWSHDGEPPAATLARVAPAPEELRTLRAYLVDGRLTTIPAQGRKRQVVLRFLLERLFPDDRVLPEKEVNQRLAVFHPDVASLRRYLVDDGYVDRAAGRYWRRRSDTPA